MIQSTLSTWGVPLPFFSRRHLAIFSATPAVFFAALVVGLALLASDSANGQDAAVIPPLAAAELGSTANVHRAGSLYLAGQFEPADLEIIKGAGIGRVITLRKSSEIDWDEKEAVEAAGLAWHEFPFRDARELSDEFIDSVRALLEESQQTPTLLHCATANRVGGVWLAFRVLDQGVAWETALNEAEAIGLKNGSYLARIQEYVEARNAEAFARVVSADLNRDFLDPNLDVDQWIQRFEVESREIFAQRLEILKAVEVVSGARVADIGAGTGLFTRLLAHEVGSEGHVYAVEISAAFLQHINHMARELGVSNISAVLCREDSVGLPLNSVDQAFVCDTYHHFAFPRQSLDSIHRALKPGGMLVVVDFERVPGQSRDWVLQHVRAGKDVVRGEIESAGFEFIDEPHVAGLQENYMLRFRRPQR
jgi:uncharacterized protein (TIGR01244 family)